MKIKVVNLKKFIRSIVLVMLIIGFISLFFTSLSFSYGDTEYKTIYIENGDTLWNIAKNERNNNKYYNNKDIRYIIEDIKNENNLKNSNLQIGQEIKIPIL